MKLPTIATLFLIPVCANAGGLLGDAISNIGRVSDSKQLDIANKRILGEAAFKIERAELAQSLQVDALTKRIVELENTVRKQQELLNSYQKLVLELQAKIGSTK